MEVKVNGLQFTTSEKNRSELKEQNSSGVAV